MLDRRTAKAKLCVAAGKCAKTLLNFIFSGILFDFLNKIYINVQFYLSFIEKFMCICRLDLLYTDFGLCISVSSYSVHCVVYECRRNYNAIY